MDQAAYAELASLFKMAICECDCEQQKLSWTLTPSLHACSVGLVVSTIKVTSDESLKFMVNLLTCLLVLFSSW